MKQLAVTVAGVGLLHWAKPVERIPMVGKYAAEVETLAGAAMIAGVIVKKSENPWVKGLAQALLIDGVLKLVDKYVPKV
jgi:hypothetical protein